MSSPYFHIKPLSEEEVDNFFYVRGGESDYSLRGRHEITISITTY